METARYPVSAQPIIMTSSADIAELYENHYATVYRAALRVTGNPADAEDVLHGLQVRARVVVDRGAQTLGRVR